MSEAKPNGHGGPEAPRLVQERGPEARKGNFFVAPTHQERLADIVSEDAIAFLEELHGRFGKRRLELLAARRERDRALREGGTLDFLSETREIREGDWRVAPPRADYEDRRVEITGPTDRKLVINALNSGAKGFMADFEDANSPTWANQVGGHVNLIDAIEGTITYDSEVDDRHYELTDEVATLLVRPRGWHLPEERHLTDGRRAGGRRADGLRPVRPSTARKRAARAAAAARSCTCRRSASHLRGAAVERRLRRWPRSTWRSRTAAPARGTVLIETLPAAFQMEEILHELREHSGGPERRPLGLHLQRRSSASGTGRSS